jgi:hypothetical protein
LLSFAAFNQSAFAICCQQQRGEILICFRKLVKHFLKISSKNFSALDKPLQLAPNLSARFANLVAASCRSRQALRCDQRSPLL